MLVKGLAGHGGQDAQGLGVDRGRGQLGHQVGQYGTRLDRHHLAIIQLADMSRLSANGSPVSNHVTPVCQ